MLETATDQTVRRVRCRIEAWAGGLGGVDPLDQGGALAPPRPVPGLLRRRIGPIGRRALEAVWAVLPDGPMPRLVLSSRHGEYDRTFGLLSELADSGQMSPAEFSLAVHHALAGLMSIATGSDAGHLAVSAGADSLGFGLIEAAGCAGTDRNGAILLHFDAPLPEAYRTVAEPDPPAAVLALRLGPPDARDGIGLEIELKAVALRAPEPTGLAGGLLAVLRGAAVTDGRGDRFAWRWRRQDGGGDA